MLNTITGYTLLAIITTAIWAPLLINLLYRMDIVIKTKLMSNRMNEEFMKIHGHKAGTPTLGGLMISVTVFLLVLVILPQTPIRDVFLIGWALFTLYGLADGMLVYARKLTERFKLIEASFGWRIGKLLVLYLLCLLTVVLAQNYLGVSSVSMFGLFSIPFNAVTIILGAGAITFGIYGIEITDGADGLAVGQYIITMLAFLALAILGNSPAVIPFAALIIGSCVVYYYFNINPARVFMGGTGTYPIGFAMFLFALVTNTMDILLIVGLVYWFEAFSSAIQVLAIKFLKRKIFRIAPIHHYFEAIGWPETKMVQRFWWASAIFAIVALWVFSITR